MGEQQTEVQRVREQIERQRRRAVSCMTVGHPSDSRAASVEANVLERFALPLAEEVDRLRELVGRFVRNASNGRELAPRWVSMKTATGHGSTVASALCVEFGVDPAEDAGVRQPYPGEECPFCGEEVPIG